VCPIFFYTCSTTNTYVFILFTGVEGRSPEYEEPRDLRSNPFQGGGDDAILPPKVLDRRLQEDWARDTKEGPRVLMNLRVDFLSPWTKVGSSLLCKY